MARTITIACPNWAIARQSWLGEHFRYRGLSFDQVICGNMNRHHQTAEGIIRGMGLEPVLPDTDPAWNEFDFEAIVAAWLQQNPQEQPAPEASPQTFSRVLRNALLAWAENGLEAQLPEAWRRVRGARSNWPGIPDRAARRWPADSAGQLRRRHLHGPAPGTRGTGQRHGPHESAVAQFQRQPRCSSTQRNIHFSGFNHVPHLDHPDRGGAVTYY